MLLIAAAARLSCLIGTFVWWPGGAGYRKCLRREYAIPSQNVPDEVKSKDRIACLRIRILRSVSVPPLSRPLTRPLEGHHWRIKPKVVTSYILHLALPECPLFLECFYRMSKGR